MNQPSSITNKQQTILLLLYRFRFLKSSQIQQLLNHKDYKTIYQWLRDLNEKEYISKRPIYSNHSAAYYLAPSGINYLKTNLGYDNKLVQKYYREQNRSLTFVNSSILISNIYLDLYGRSDTSTKFKMSVKSDYPSHQYNDLLCSLKPHAYITQTTTDSLKEYFVEIISDQPRERLRQRIKNYLYFFQSNDWEAETERESPTILFICPNDQILEYIRGYTKRKLAIFDELSPIIHLTTVEQIKQTGITGDIWREI